MIVLQMHLLLLKPTYKSLAKMSEKNLFYSECNWLVQNAQKLNNKIYEMPFAWFYLIIHHLKFASILKRGLWMCCTI